MSAWEITIRFGFGICHGALALITARDGMWPRRYIPPKLSPALSRLRRVTRWSVVVLLWGAASLAFSDFTNWQWRFLQVTHLAFLVYYPCWIVLEYRLLTREARRE